MKSKSKELSFDGQKVYVGIDVHLKNWRVTILLEHISHKTFSQEKRLVLYSISLAILNSTHCNVYSNNVV